MVAVAAGAGLRVSNYAFDPAASKVGVEAPWNPTENLTWGDIAFGPRVGPDGTPVAASAARR